MAVKKKNTKLDKGPDRARLMAIALFSVFVILTGTWFSANSFGKGEILTGVVSVIISVSILALALFITIRGNRDLKEGYPLKDERSRKVIEKATSAAFYASLYLLLAIGFMSDGIIPFKDASQAISISVGGMALLFLGFWVYYNGKEL
jgi:amino acid transporter